MRPDSAWTTSGSDLVLNGTVSPAGAGRPQRGRGVSFRWRRAIRLACGNDEQSPQHSSRPIEPGADRAAGDSKVFRDFRVGAPAGQVQIEDGLKMRREVRRRGLHIFELKASPQGKRLGFWRGYVAQRRRIREPLARAMPTSIDEEVGHDAEQPRTWVRPRSKLPKVRPASFVGVLHEIPGARLRMLQTVCPSQKERLCLPRDRLKRHAEIRNVGRPRIDHLPGWPLQAPGPTDKRLTPAQDAQSCWLSEVDLSRVVPKAAQVAQSPWPIAQFDPASAAGKSGRAEGPISRRAGRLEWR